LDKLALPGLRRRAGQSDLPCVVAKADTAAGDIDPEALAYARRALLGERVEQHPQAS
jgi:hypothetical protein